MASLFSKKGVVTAKKKGKAVITAKAGAKKLTCKVTVRNAKAEVSQVTFYRQHLHRRLRYRIHRFLIRRLILQRSLQMSLQKYLNRRQLRKYVQEGAFVYDKLDISWIDPEKPMIAFTFDDGPVGSSDKRLQYENT